MADRSYAEFIHNKLSPALPDGIDVENDINPMLYDFQRDIVRWALRKGRAAIFADCGLGKTPMQLEWANHIPGRVLILAPLAVSEQTVREGIKFGVDVTYARTQKDSDAGHRITITNYEMLKNFDPNKYTGIVLDESSILKSYTGKFRTMIIEQFARTPYRLACTATPAPNDYMEIGNHAEFMGIMTRAEMLSMFFIHDAGETQKWRLKGHGEYKFWQWLCSFAVMIRKPSDLGYDDGDFILPELRVHHVQIETESTGEYLFPMEAQTLRERISARRETVGDRARACANLINGDQSSWLIWCNLNRESEVLVKMIDDAVEIKGSDKHDYKASTMLEFSSEDIKRLVTKPSIAGFGMNWQHCHNVAFVGLNDSYESYYQATRRCWRFGQKHPVDVHIITADIEGAVLKNIARKEAEAKRMAENMVDNMSELSKVEIRKDDKATAKYAAKTTATDRWTMINGDCVEEIKTIEDNSIDYSIFSPPFASLYTYSDSDRDMGNCKDQNDFIQHFGYLIPELLRVTAPGRLLSFHCMNLPTSKTHDGYIGIKDFRGDLIRLFVSHGWIYHSEVVIWKNPVTAMQRTKALGLLHKQLAKDSSMCRMGIPDYLVTMRKPGDNKKPIKGELTEFVGDKATFARTGKLSIDIWQRYASPIWTDINQSRTLQASPAREEKDERHICPLQLDVIDRCLQLWTRKGDFVLSPFAGIGSEGYCSVKMERKFIGIELKGSYFDMACKNLMLAESELNQEVLAL